MKIPWFRFVAVYLILACTAAAMALYRMRPSPLERPLEQFPSTLGEWHVAQQEYFNPALLSVLRPQDYLSRRYVGPGRQSVDLYIGYHDQAQGSGPIHSPKNCLPGNGWFELSSRPMEAEIGGEKVRMTQALYRQGDRQELFVYWFMVRDWTLDTEIGLKVAEILNAIRNGQRGASFIRVNLRADGDPNQAARIAESFLKQAYPAIRAFLAS